MEGELGGGFREIGFLLKKGFSSASLALCGSMEREIEEKCMSALFFSF